MGAAGRSQHMQNEVWMRNGALRRLYGSHRRRGDTILHYPGRQCRGGRSDYYRTIGETPAGRKVQQAWLDHDVVQCGYCQSGADHGGSCAAASNPRPTESEINDAMSGNVCRCGTYNRIRAAIKYASEGGR